MTGIFGMLFLLSACSAGQEEGQNPAWEKIPTAGPAVVQEEEYREIYRRVVTRQEGEGITFSLIYLDADETPELVVCDGGYGVYSIYTVKDGADFCMVNAMNTVELSYFERSGIIARFQRWNGGGDEGGYGMDFYRVSGDQTLTDGDAPILQYSYDASGQEGAETREGVTNYYDRDQEIDESAYRLRMEELGIAQGEERPVAENACQGQEMLERLKGAQGKTQEQKQSPPEGRILDQSFPTELDGFGKVIFSSFDPISYPSENPDYGTTMFGDVRFMLLSPESGEKIYDFPGETKDNILSGFNRLPRYCRWRFGITIMTEEWTFFCCWNMRGRAEIFSAKPESIPRRKGNMNFGLTQSFQSIWEITRKVWKGCGRGFRASGQKPQTVPGRLPTSLRSVSQRR